MELNVTHGTFKTSNARVSILQYDHTVFVRPNPHFLLLMCIYAVRVVLEVEFPSETQAGIY